MSDLVTLLLQARKISGDSRFDTLKPMREVHDLLAQALDIARESGDGQASGEARKQLVVIEMPQPICSQEAMQACDAHFKAKLDAGGLRNYELLILDGGATLHIIEGDDETDPSGEIPQAADHLCAA